MLENILLLIIGLAALFLGAEGLVRGSASLAVRSGLTPLSVGLTIVAYGTSMPELVVSSAAAWNNQAAIAIGNVVGSNIFNIGIILGFTALLCPIKVSFQVIKYDTPLMVAVSLLALLLIGGGFISRTFGTALVIMLIAYTVYTLKQAKKGTAAEITQEFKEGIPRKSKSLALDLLLIGSGLPLLAAGAHLLLVAAVEIAHCFEISEAVIALTVIAAGTSLPEFATSVVAALRRQPDIAVGNIIGSNIFNVLGVLGTAAMVKPLDTSGIMATDLWFMVIFSIVLLPFLYTGLKLQRGEGILLLLGYGVYLWLLWP